MKEGLCFLVVGVSITSFLKGRRKQLFLLFLLFLVFDGFDDVLTTTRGVSAERPSVSSATSVLKGVSEVITIIGDQTQFAEFVLEANQDLYYTEGVPCRESCFEPDSDSSLFCDYTTYGEGCGKDLPRSGPFADLCRDNKEHYCDSGLVWEKLKEGRMTASKRVEQNQVSFYRLYSHKPCHAIRINFDLFGGEAAYFVGVHYLPPTATRYVAFNGNTAIYNPSMVFCPSHLTYFMGTITIGVYSTGKEANFSIGYEYLNLKEETNPAKKWKKEEAKKACDLASNDHRCLLADTFNPLEVDSFDEKYFQYDFDSCQELHIWSEIVGDAVVFNIDLEDEVNILLTWSLSISVTEEKPSTIVNTTPRTKVLLSGSDTFVEVCPEEGNKKGSLFLSLFSTIQANFTIMIERDQKSWKRVPLRNLYENPYNSYSKLYGAATLTCDDTREGKEGEKQKFHCEPSNLQGSTCENWFPFVTDPFEFPPQFFVKMNPLIYYYVTQLQSQDFVFERKPNDRRISFAFILEAQSTIFYPYEHFSSCKIQMTTLSPISNKNGKRIVGEFIVEQKTPDCSDDLRLIMETQELLLDELLEVDNLGSVLSRIYLLDRLLTLDPFLGCKRLIDSLVDSTQEVMNITTDYCTYDATDPSYYNDPCCSPFSEDAWDGCCLYEEKAYNYTSFSTLPSSEIVEECSDPKCTEIYLENYVFFNQFSANVPFCSLDIEKELASITAAISGYETCKVTAFGGDLQGIPCFRDSECVSKKCDLVSRKCLYTTELEDIFWKVRITPLASVLLHFL